MIKRLIINADDFGISEGATLGIIKAHKDGILTSTTCMMNMPYATQALQLASQYPHLKIGIHLVLTIGEPLIKGDRNYLTSDHQFIRPKDYPSGHPSANKDELYQEWKAQIEKFIKVTGHKPDHIDSHHHVHLLKEHQSVILQLAHEYNIPIRQRDKIDNVFEYVPCIESFYKDGVSLHQFKDILDQNEGTIELMVHPAFLDWRLYQISSYNTQRMKELALLTSDAFKNIISDYCIQLITYSDLKKME